MFRGLVPVYPVASFSYALIAIDVVAAQANTAPQDPCPGLMIGLSIVFLWHFFDVPYAVLI